MKNALNITIVVLAITCIALGTLDSANKRRTALYGLQLPNRVLVDAWNPSNDELVGNMRDYRRSLSPAVANKEVARWRPRLWLCRPSTSTARAANICFTLTAPRSPPCRKPIARSSKRHRTPAISTFRPTAPKRGNKPMPSMSRGRWRWRRCAREPEAICLHVIDSGKGCLKVRLISNRGCLETGSLLILV
jgi:hypothetical protein